jgi:hypothetical protein
MTALATPIPAPAQRRPTKIAAIALAVTAAVLALAGAVALAGDLFRDGEGYFNSPTKTFTSHGYAIAMKSVDVSDAPSWVFGRHGISSIRVKAYGDQPLFLGIARVADIDRYLRGTDHDDVSGLTYYPFHVSYDHFNGLAPRTSPANESFWAKSARGSGSLTLAWKPRPGNWRAVLMNAGGSSGVTATMQFGVRTPLVKWISSALLVLAILAAATAAVLNRRARA